MNSKGIELIVQDQLERLRRAIAMQEAQVKQLVQSLRDNRAMESKLSELVK